MLPKAKEIVQCVLGDKAAKEIEKVSHSNDTVKRRVDDWNFRVLSTQALHFLILFVSICLYENTCSHLSKHKYLKRNYTYKMIYNLKLPTRSVRSKRHQPSRKP